MRTSDHSKEPVPTLTIEEKKEGELSIRSRVRNSVMDVPGGSIVSRIPDMSKKMAPCHNGAPAADASRSNETGRQPRGRGGVFGFITFGVHLGLFILALSLAGAYVVRVIYGDYYVPMMKRARRTNRNLLDEYTYYDRKCNMADLTASVNDATGIIYESDSSAISQMMTHGAIMLPELLPPSLIAELRQFVVEKNAAVKGTEAEYPVSQGANRISYGIEAAEHPAVIKALKGIHDNTKLKSLLEGLVGKNPALTEITAITSYFGCDEQYWHSDVKADGYAAKFGRTYSHSYSLFIPLQNTTGEMGATDICPGTHYCTDQLHEVCEANKIGMHQVRGEGVWRAGDAALLNQQIWHRGAQHQDEHGLERIVFIVSFIGRPTDTRQLARGTYFHMKWNMWGHTWQDLADSAVSMTWPFNILRCLHIWKPKGRDWGFDLLTATAMRVANKQGGCEPGDLLLLTKTLTKLGFPEWLFGTIDPTTRHAWPIFIQETIDNTFDFLKQTNIVALAAYAFFLLIAAIRMQFSGRSGVKCIFGTSLRLMFLYGAVLALMLYTLDAVRTSPWAKNISSGKTLMRPFPEEELIWRDDDPAVSKGPTTLPYRQDVLIGTRMNSKTIGAYRYWIDFHPGNRMLREHIAVRGGPLYRSYEKGLPEFFSKKLIDDAYDLISKSGGRFLQQDYRNGDWRIMETNETREYIRLRLLLGDGSLLAALIESFDFLMDEYRFGVQRGTALAYMSQAYLWQIHAKLFGTNVPAASESKPARVSMHGPTRVAVLSNNSNGIESQPFPLTTQRRLVRWRTFPKEEIVDIRLYSEVVYHTMDDLLIPATVIGFTKKGKVKIAFYGEDANEDGRTLLLVSRKRLRISPPIMEGTRVEANYLDQGDWFTGTLTHVRPSGRGDVWFDDEDFEEGVLSYNYSPLDE